MSRASSSRKNSPNKEGAYAYLDAMLDKSAQEAFAVDIWVTIPRSATPWSRPISTSASGSPPTRSRSWSISTQLSQQNDVALKEWWDKELKG